MSAKKATQKSAKSTTASGKKSKGFTKEERAAMKERAQELKAEASQSDVLAKIDEMPEPDRAMAKRLQSQATPTETAQAAPPNGWRHDEQGQDERSQDGQGHEDEQEFVFGARCSR